MSNLSEIEPKDSQRLIDLVKAAGVDVSDWGNFKGGKKKAASNPKYCYAWAFVEPKKVVVLTLWHALMEEQDGGLIRKLNMREFAAKRRGIESSRSLITDDAIQTAVKDNLPIRVVVLEGRRRDINDFTLLCRNLL
jgi:5-methylcytosine-specific restriction enzyme A